MLLVSTSLIVCIILFTKSSSQEVYDYDVWDFKAKIWYVSKRLDDELDRPPLPS